MDPTKYIAVEGEQYPLVESNGLTVDGEPPEMIYEPGEALAGGRATSPRPKSALHRVAGRRTAGGGRMDRSAIMGRDGLDDFLPNGTLRRATAPDARESTSGGPDRPRRPHATQQPRPGVACDPATEQLRAEIRRAVGASVARLPQDDHVSVRRQHEARFRAREAALLRAVKEGRLTIEPRDTALDDRIEEGDS